MLTDYQRKVLRILYNYSGIRRRFPTIHELTVKTGKYEPDVKEALNALIDAGYISWDDKSDTNTIVILEGWELESERPITPQPKPKQTDISYWTEY